MPEDNIDLVLKEKEGEVKPIEKHEADILKSVKKGFSLVEKEKDTETDSSKEATVDKSINEEKADECHYSTFNDQFNLPMFKCVHCNLTYSQKHVMKKHIKTHTRWLDGGIIPVKCDECLKSFHQSSLLKLHKERVHRKLKNYFCFVCEKGFHDRHGMLEHIITHDDARKSEE